MENLFIEENKAVANIFNLQEVLDFQLKHDVQIVRGEDYQYICYIDGIPYFTSLTPIHALCYGIIKKINNQ